MTTDRFNPKSWLKAHWPALRLRVILLSVLVFVAALPGFGALFLRVYENTLVRQTEAELIAQGAAVGAAVASDWPGASGKPIEPPPAPPSDASRDRSISSGYGECAPGPADYYRPEPLTIDLRTTPVLPDRPDRPADGEPLADAAVAGDAAMPVFLATGRTTLASIRLIDRSGVVAAGVSDRGERLGDLPEIKAALAGRTMTLLRADGNYRRRYFAEMFSRAAGIRVHHARPVIVDGRVVGALLLSRSPRGLFVGLYQDRGKIAFGSVLIFLMLLGIAGLLSRAIAKPIEVLGEATRDVARGGGRIPQAPSTAAIEIRALYADFAEMAAAIDRRSRYLRDFAHAVSHEFKTPLAGITGAIELLQDHLEDMSEADRQRFLTNASNDAQRLSMLVSRLLDLARADMSRPEAGAATMLPPLLHRIADGHGNARFTVSVDALDGLPAAAIPEGSIAAIITSLIENSRQAGAAHATITVRASAGSIIIHVADDGPGIADADRARIFEPFFTGRRESGGTGLGLPIARSLLDAAGGDIEIGPGGRGAAFVITVPQATMQGDRP